MTKLNKHKNSIAFLYPGQGSQHVGMGLKLGNRYPTAQDLFKQADDLLGFSLRDLCFEGPEEVLNQDLNAQLAVYTVSCIITDILKEKEVLPNITSGYSSGFYGAAYAAGCFDFAYGLEIVRRAGELLLDEGRKTDGGMAVIFGLSPEQVDDICKRTGDVWIAIRNTPRQTIISGTSSAVKKAMAVSRKEKALDAYPISVATAYHSRLVKGTEARLLKDIDDKRLNAPQVPLISYLSLSPVTDRSELKHMMARQLSRPVLWTDLVKQLGKNHKLMIEVGPGAVISRTVIWIDRNIEIINTAKENGLKKAIERCRALRARAKINSHSEATR